MFDRFFITGFPPDYKLVFIYILQTNDFRLDQSNSSVYCLDECFDSF